MWKVIAMGLVLGAAISGLSLPLTGQREAFDAVAYYLCATFVAGALSALPAPRFWWVAVPAVSLGEHLYYAAAYPHTRPAFLFGLLFNALLPTWWAAALGAFATFLCRRTDSR